MSIIQARSMTTINRFTSSSTTPISATRAARWSSETHASISVPRKCTRWSKPLTFLTANRFKLTSQTAYTARHATSWTRTRSSPGCRRKAEAVRITMACECCWLLANSKSQNTDWTDSTDWTDDSLGWSRTRKSLWFYAETDENLSEVRDVLRPKHLKSTQSNSHSSGWKPDPFLTIHTHSHKCRLAALRIYDLPLFLSVRSVQSVQSVF